MPACKQAYIYNQPINKHDNLLTIDPIYLTTAVSNRKIINQKKQKNKQVHVCRQRTNKVDFNKIMSAKLASNAPRGLTFD